MQHPNPIIEEDIKCILENAILSRVEKSSCYLVSGASGFVASYLIESLLRINEVSDKTCRVIALARNEERFWKRFDHHKNNPNLDFFCRDVVDDLSDLKGLGVSHVVHAASKASPKFYGIDPVGTLKANTLGTLNLLELATLNKACQFVFVSSAEVYGQTNEIPTSEKGFGYLDPAEVRSCYAESKRMGENICMSWMRQYGLSVKVVRPFHTYGPGMDLDDGRVYADFVKNILNCEPIKLSSDGSAMRAFCYLRDAIKAIYRVIYFGCSGEVYNFGNSEQEFSIKQLACLLQKKYKERVAEVIFHKEGITNGYLPSQVDRICPDISKIRELGWKPETSVRAGFDRTVTSYMYELG